MINEKVKCTGGDRHQSEQRRRQEASDEYPCSYTIFNEFVFDTHAHVSITSMELPRLCERCSGGQGTIIREATRYMLRMDCPARSLARAYAG